jgi:LmbE family N-acetylglucosaminyl deacetylase
LAKREQLSAGTMLLLALRLCTERELPSATRQNVKQLSRGLHAASTPRWNRSWMAAAILSPHLDDAVLSCWHVLAQPGDVIVVNVFAGVPASTAALAWWDELTGARDSRQRARERVEEDRQALALAGRKPVNLAFLDDQYRDVEQPLAPVAAQIAGLLVPGVHVYAPAAFGGHADHTLVRAAGLELRRRGFVVSLYAELPHATLHGWPAWVTGAGIATSAGLAAALWDRTLAETRVSPTMMPREVHALDPHCHARKLEAVRAYVTQLEGLVGFVGRPLTDRETLGYEVVWNLPATPTPSSARACRRGTARP